VKRALLDLLLAAAPVSADEPDILCPDNSTHCAISKKALKDLTESAQRDLPCRLRT
jgi:hypothetical protein